MGYEAIRERDPCEPEEKNGDSARGTRACRQSTRTGSLTSPALMASRGHCLIAFARGIRCPTTRGGCLSAWPRCMRGLYRIPITILVACSTTSRSLVSSTTRSSSSPPTTARAARAVRTVQFNEVKFFNNVPDTIEENIKHIEELGSPSILQPLLHRLGVGLRYAFPVLEALCGLRRGDIEDMAPRGMATGDSSTKRCATPVHSRYIDGRAYDLRPARPRTTLGTQPIHAEPHRGRELQAHR